MASRIGRVRRHGRGQTLVEFALTLPVFLLMTLGVVDAARLYMAQIALTGGVREAAMFASTGNYGLWCRNPADPSQADPTMPVPVACPAGANAANYGADPGNLAYRIAIETQGLDYTRITLFPPTCGTGAGAPTSACSAVPSPTRVAVHARYTFDVLTPVLSQIWGSSVVIDATSTAQVIK